MTPDQDWLDMLGPLLSVKDLARIWEVTVSQAHRLNRQGAFDRFRVTPVIGPRQFSKLLIQRYLAGEPIDLPARVFGRKRSA